jgi:type II secretory pathway pseudopilin PulG
MEFKTKSKKGFSLVEALISLLLCGTIIYVLSTWICFFSFSSKNLEKTLSKTEQNIVSLQRMARLIDFVASPIELESTTLKFAYSPLGLEGKAHPLIFVKITERDKDLVLEKTDSENQILENFVLIENGDNFSIALLGFLFQENKKTFVEIDTLRPNQNFIPYAFRFKSHKTSFDVSLPILIDESSTLSLHLAPT